MKHLIKSKYILIILAIVFLLVGSYVAIVFKKSSILGGSFIGFGLGCVEQAFPPKRWVRNLTMTIFSIILILCTLYSMDKL